MIIYASIFFNILVTFDLLYFQDVSENLPIYLNFHLTPQMFDLEIYILAYLSMIIKSVVTTYNINRSNIENSVKLEFLEEIIISLIKFACVLLVSAVFFGIFSVYDSNHLFKYIWFRENLSAASFLGLGFVILTLLLKYFYTNFVKNLFKNNLIV